MKRSLATLFLGALCASLCSSCVTDGSKMHDHWNPSSMPTRMQRTLTGYDASRDGSVTEWLARDADSISTTVQRHLLGFNPDNPNEEEGGGTFSYTYVEAQLGFLGEEGVNEDADLTSVSILADMVGGTFLRAERFGEDHINNAGATVSESSLALGLGFRVPISDVIDIYGIGSYVNDEVHDGPEANSGGRTGFGVTGGLRYRPIPSVDLGAAYDWANFTDGPDRNVFTLSGFVDVFGPVSLGARVLVRDNAEAVTMGLRFHF